ncbi:MAG: hypothetical protein JKY51_00245, partial [Opitutaceae bacterium]|nr:hypothetical protein [Opitutaceae bacterium]
KLAQFEHNGGTLITFINAEQLLEKLSKTTTRDITLNPPNNDLRFIHIQKEGLDFYLLVNEGEETIKGELQFQIKGAVEYWDPWSGEREPCPAKETPDGTSIELTLGYRESRILVFDQDGFFLPTTLSVKSKRPIPLETTWTVQTEDSQSVKVPALTDWAQCKGFELFTGTLVYRANIEIPQDAEEVSIDLGQVGDIAEVFLNGESKGVRMWAPYRFDLEKTVALAPHQLEVRITNSMANEYNGAQMPSGLMGPVELLV